MPLEAGKQFGMYRILSLLGSGGIGDVYRARDTKLNRDVALKVLPDFFESDHDRLARFTREAQLLASLNHPNIAAIYRFFLGCQGKQGIWWFRADGKGEPEQLTKSKDSHPTSFSRDGKWMAFTDTNQETGNDGQTTDRRSK